MPIRALREQKLKLVAGNIFGALSGLGSDKMQLNKETRGNISTSANVEEIFRQYRMSPFAEWVGIKIDSLAEGYCRLSLLLEDKCKNYTDGIHGGVLATMADTCMGGAVRSLGLQAVTAELTVNYLGKPSVGDELTAEGRIVHRGSTIILTECIIKSGSHKNICSGRGIFVSRVLPAGGKDIPASK